MVPLIESEVVNTHHWITHQEFVEAFALGQITPGPVLITATFIGYRVAGTLGALVATVCIFLPSLCLTIAAGSSLRRFRANRQVQAFLRGVTPAVVGLPHPQPGDRDLETVEVQTVLTRQVKPATVEVHVPIGVDRQLLDVEAGPVQTAD